MRHGTDLTEGAIGRHLFSLGMFLALSVFAMMATSLVDVYFVARLGPHPLAALSFTFPILMVTSAIALGFGNGVVAVVARAVGENNPQTTRNLGTDSVLLAGMIVLILSSVGLLTIEPLFTMLGADAEVMPLIKGYMHIWYAGATMQIIPQVAQVILRAHGDTRTPGLITFAMCIANVILDPIFIYGWGPIPAFGLEGAAIANVLARTLSFTSVLGILIFRMHALAPISFDPQRLKHSWSKLLHIGLPSTATQLVQPLAAAVLTKVIALSGTLAVASFGVASRIEMVTSVYLWAVGGAMPPFVGQNVGADRMDRVQGAVRIATRFCFWSGICAMAIANLFAPQIVARFTTDPDVQHLAAFYLRTVSVSYSIAGLVMVGGQTMNALARPFPAAMISLARSVGLVVPLALLGQWLGQIHGVFIGIACANAICGALAWVVLQFILKQECRRHAAMAPVPASA
jgi:putative MATE family efflux protein